jgi:putative cell wall-binding protein
MSAVGQFYVYGVSDDTAVVNTWTPTTPGAWHAKTSIVAYRLADGQRTEVCTGPLLRGGGSISGNWVVWWDARNSVKPVGGPDIGWDDIPNGNSDIYSYDLSTGVESVVCTDTGNQRDPEIDGDYVVWTDYSAVTNSMPFAALWPSEIKGVNLRTGQRFSVTSNGLHNGEIDISNGWVVYTSYGLTSYTGHVMAYEIATGRTIQLTQKAGQVSVPQIASNGLAAWNLQSPGNAMNILGCNVYDRKILNLATGKGSQSGPALGGNMLIYQDGTKPGGYPWVGYDFLAGTRFGVAVKGKLWVDQYLPASNGAIALVEDDFEAARRKGSWPEGAIFTLSVVRPTVFGTYSAPDAFAAAVAQSQQDFPAGAQTVVLANGGIWDDDVVAAGLAGADSPVLFTGRDAIPPATLAELMRLAPKRVQVVGGPTSVSDAVVAAVASALGGDTVVERAGSGNAINTSIGALRAASDSALAVSAVGSHPYDGTVVVVSASNKVLSGLVVPVLRGRHIPVVFAGKSFSAGQVAAMKAAGVKRVVIVGGTKDVSATAARQLSSLVGGKSVLRITGASTYQTAARFDDYAIRHFGMKLDGVGIQTAVASTDGLMAGLKGGRTGSLLVLTGAKKLSTYAAGLIKGRRTSVRRAVYVGRGSRLVSKPVRKAVRLIVH